MLKEQIQADKVWWEQQVTQAKTEKEWADRRDKR
jgi:hypothetical protein